MGGGVGQWEPFGLLALLPVCVCLLAPMVFIGPLHDFAKEAFTSIMPCQLRNKVVLVCAVIATFDYLVCELTLCKR